MAKGYLPKKIGGDQKRTRNFRDMASHKKRDTLTPSPARYYLAEGLCATPLHKMGIDEKSKLSSLDFLDHFSTHPSVKLQLCYCCFSS